MRKEYTTIVEIFDARGYTILEQDEENIIAAKDDGALICAFIPIHTMKFNIEQFQNVVNMAKQMEIQHCVVVYDDTITSSAKKMVEISTEIKVELFKRSELQYNLTKHVWVPKHRLYARKGTKEAAEFIGKYGSKFPALLKTDPVARFYEFQTGDIVEVTRSNGFVAYRYVK